MAKKKAAVKKAVKKIAKKTAPKRPSKVAKKLPTKASAARATGTKTMKVFWNDCGRGVVFDSPKTVDLAEAGLIWSDEVRGVEGNFIGLIDADDRTIQFYFEDGIPDDVDDASHLRIVQMDFPAPEKKGSYQAKVTIGEVHGLIERAFKVGAAHQRFAAAKFKKW